MLKLEKRRKINHASLFLIFFLHVGEVEFSTEGLFLDFQIEQLKPQEKNQI